MKAHIFIHCFGEIVEKFDVDFEEISELTELFDYARIKYGGKDSFCFDVMIT